MSRWIGQSRHDGSKEERRSIRILEERYSDPFETSSKSHVYSTGSYACMFQAVAFFVMITISIGITVRVGYVLKESVQLYSPADLSTF